MSVRLVTTPWLTKNFAGGSLATWAPTSWLEGLVERLAAPPSRGRPDTRIVAHGSGCGTVKFAGSRSADEVGGVRVEPDPRSAIWSG